MPSKTDRIIEVPFQKCVHHLMHNFWREVFIANPSLSDVCAYDGIFYQSSDSSLGDKDLQDNAGVLRIFINNP